MGHQLKILPLEGGLSMKEKACEHYQCRSCKKKMISANFVSGICIQVFVSHGADCREFTGNAFQRTKEVDCSTCIYDREACGCVYEGEADSRIQAVRAAG